MWSFIYSVISDFVRIEQLNYNLKCSYKKMFLKEHLECYFIFGLLELLIGWAYLVKLPFLPTVIGSML